MTFLLWMGLAHGSPLCEATTPDRLGDLVGLAEASLQAADATAFTTRVSELRMDVACVEGVVSPALAARVHRAVGVQLFLDGLPERAREAFAAARRLAPGQDLPWYPPGHPLTTLWSEAEPGSITEPLPPLAPEAVLWVDGVRTQERFPDQAAWLQLEADGGWTGALHHPGLPLPSWTAWQPLPEPPPLPGVEAPPEVERPGRKVLRYSLAGATGALAVGSAVTLGLAWERRGSFDDPDVGSYDELDDLRDQANNLTIASAVLGGLALGVGTALVFTF